jgi:hypothetical protein
MSNSKNIQLMLAALVLVAVGNGCGAAQEQADETPAKPAVPAADSEGDEPTFRVWSFGVLDEATREAGLPYLIDADGSRLETACYVRARGLKPWETERAKVIGKIESKREGIHQAILEWLEATMLPEGTNTKGWQTAYEKPTVVHAPDAKLRLAADQQCVDDKGALPEGSKTVTTLFGAKTLRIKSPAPFEKKLVKQLRKSAKKAKVWLKPIKAYRRALDEDGDPVSGPDGKKLFLAPDGRLVPAKQIPKGAKRRIYELELSSWAPLWFAFGDLPDDGWAREFGPETCGVNLVFDDATPRAADCDEAAEVGFGVRRGSEDRVEVRATADGFTAKAEVPFGSVLKLQVSGRVVVWVKPKKILEGALLKVNSLVLDPESAADAPPDSFPKAEWKSN